MSAAERRRSPARGTEAGRGSGQPGRHVAALGGGLHEVGAALRVLVRREREGSGAPGVMAAGAVLIEDGSDLRAPGGDFGVGLARMALGLQNRREQGEGKDGESNPARGLKEVHGVVAPGGVPSRGGADDGAADGGAGGLVDRSAGEDLMEDALGEVPGGVGALEAEADVAVVDAAGVDGGPASSGVGVSRSGDEDGDLGGDAGAGHAGERAVGISDGSAAGVEGALVGDDGGGWVGGVGIDEPEADVLRGELFAEALHLGEGAVGDGAVGGDKEEDDRAGGGVGERGDGAAGGSSA